MSCFADASALVKLYVPEAGHQQVRAIGSPIVIASLARAELPAAFWAKVRAGELADAVAALLVRAFEFDYHGDDASEARFVAVAVTDPVLAAAARLARLHGLRAYDAVQLGCALTARDADPSVDTFAVFDRALRQAAITEGFTPLP